MTKGHADQQFTRPTPAACVKMGGHCWPSVKGSFLSGDVWRECIHCYQKQRGKVQDSVKWEDLSDG